MTSDLNAGQVHGVRGPKAPIFDASFSESDPFRVIVGIRAGDVHELANAVVNCYHFLKKTVSDAESRSCRNHGWNHCDGFVVPTATIGIFRAVAVPAAILIERQLRPCPRFHISNMRFAAGTGG